MLRVGRFSLESRFWWERFGKTLALLSRTGAGIFVEEQTESYVLVLIMQWPLHISATSERYIQTHTHVMYVYIYDTEHFDMTERRDSSGCYWFIKRRFAAA
jgi:hypothetical protein